ncbi:MULTISPECIES: NAD-dependent epimerase/dehydratase family protein [unclassified Marinovum]|uniref:NAD-dependent epimerase/dehydratase family protein n=1 Tax=unclassified Marinovum TaxID=2647166 RepID=UPI003EDBCB0C
MKNCNPIVPETLREVTLCITGSTGYVGGHLVRTLVAAGHRPFLIGRPGQSLATQDTTDIAAPWDDPEALARQIEMLDNPVLLNIAGHFVKQHGPDDITPLVSGNLEFPLLVFEAMALSGATRLVNIGTSWEYDDTGAEQPANLYAALKACNARLLEHFARVSMLRAINLKLNDTYGGVDRRAKLLPLLKAAWSEGRVLKLGTPSQPINLLHITDVIEGILAAALQTGRTPLVAKVPEAFLLAEETVTLGTLVEKLRAGPAKDLDVVFAQPEAAADILRGVWAGAPRLDEWSPRVSLATGLEDYFRVGEA